MTVLRGLVAAAGIAAVLLSCGAAAWTPPVALSGASDVEASVPSIACGPSGRVLVAYRRKSAPGRGFWQIIYRERSAEGAWGPLEEISTQSWAERPCAIEDASGSVRIYYTAHGPSGINDLYEAVKTGGTWTVNQLTNTPDYHEDYPRAAVDPTGRIHLVHLKSADLEWSNTGSVYYRSLGSGGWTPELGIGSINVKAYYHRADLCVDPADNVHVVWAENQYTLVYRRFDGASWSAKKTIGATDGYFSYAAVAALSPGSVLAVSFDSQAVAQLKYAISSDGGGTWSPFAYLMDGHMPNLAVDALGVAHLVFQEQPGTNRIGCRSWNGSAWTATQHASPAASFSAWPDVAAGAGGIHCAYDDSGVVRYVSTVPDTSLPQSPSAFAAAAGNGRVYLSWTNPGDLDLVGTLIRCSTTGYPATPGSGQLVTDAAASPGSAGAYVHTGLVNGTTYYYSAFARDVYGNCSTPAHAFAQPADATVADVKLTVADGVPVDLDFKVVTAVFAADGCIYIREPDRSAGIRVVTAQAGLSPGDVVNVSGTASTRLSSGLRLEREIINATVSEVAGPPVTPDAGPVAIVCGYVGGGASGLSPGVQASVGINSIGQLVRIAGEVTYKTGSYMFVDDGSGVENIYGLFSKKTGVMVACPDTPDVSVGDTVAATGIVEGSIPNNAAWSTNRAYLHMRDWNDFRKFPKPLAR